MSLRSHSERARLAREGCSREHPIEDSGRSALGCLLTLFDPPEGNAGFGTAGKGVSRFILLAIVCLTVHAAACGGSGTVAADRGSAAAPQQRLQAAIAEQDFDAVRAAIAAGARVREPLPTGASPLNMAVDVQNVSIVRLILASGADPNGPDPLSSATPLAAAAYATHRALVDVLLKAGADPNRRTGTGLRMTALGVAAQAAASAGIGALIRAGADIDGWNLEPAGDYPAGYRGRAEGRTALMIAAADGNDIAVLGLLAGGADPNVKNEKGETAIDLVADTGAYIREKLRHPEQFRSTKKVE